MKAGWERRRLGELLQKTGTTDPTKEPEKPFSYIDVSSVSNETFSITETSELLGKDAPSRARRSVRSGDVIFATIRPTLKRVAIVPDELDNAVCSTGYFVLRGGSKIDNTYLFYWLFSGEFEAEMEARQKGASYPAVNDSDIRDQYMPVPPLDEQRRIVAVLDNAFTGIATATANAQKNLINARALFDRYLDQAFGELDGGWGARTIGDIAAIKGGKRVPKGYKLLNEPTPYPYISVADFSDEGSVEIKKIRYISGQIFNQIKRYIIRKEDLYVSIAGTVGKTGIVPPELDGASLTENACRLVFNKGVSNRFVYYFTLTSSFKNQAIEQTRTAAQPKLALSRLQQICLPIPPQDAQEKLIATFDDLAGMVRQMEAIYQRKLTALIELKQSLLQKAFAGELT